MIKKLLNTLFSHLKDVCENQNIDESHAIGHAMKVLKISNDIYKSELEKHPYLLEQRKIIYTSAVIHDICDKKYMSEETGNNILKELFNDLGEQSLLSREEIKIVNTIVNTMSYSKVRIDGYPDLGKYQLVYHIVRESDLLAAYEYERCITYTMYTSKKDYTSSIDRAKKLFDIRILKYIEDDLFLTEYSINLAKKWHKETIEYIQKIDEILN